MVQPRASLKRLVSIALLLAGGFSTVAVAQNTNQPQPQPDDDDDDDEETTTTPQNNQPTPTRGGNNQQTTTQNNNRQTTTTQNNNQVTGLPPVTAPGGGDPTNLPTLSNFVTFSYPPPTIPPTANAPFMHRSSLPDGTVFIAVGAILGTFGAAVLLWRGIVACLLHRSVERAAYEQHLANDKAAFPAPPAPFYKYNDRDSSPSVAGTPAGRGVRRTNRGPTPSATPSQTNLFFSPTAAGSSALSGGRDSRLLPSGFYAAGSTPSPAFGHGQSMSLHNMRPDSRGQYSRNTMREPSPEGSPQLGARRDFSSSSLNLNRPPSGRAPSAYLDDLLDENPHMFPPQAAPAPMPHHPGQGPRHSHTFSHSSQGRY